MIWQSVGLLEFAGLLAELDAEGVTAVQHAIVEAAKAPSPQEKPADAAGEAQEVLLVM